MSHGLRVRARYRGGRMEGMEIERDGVIVGVSCFETERHNGVSVTYAVEAPQDVRITRKGVSID